MARNKNIRFGYNNFIDSDTTISAASSMTNFGTSNLQTVQRSQVYRPNGNFTIGSTNNSLYINDGIDKTVTLSSANYDGGAALATHVQTQLNASSSNWTCTYSTTTNKFTISRSSGTDTLRFSETTNAVWDTLGYTGSVNESAATAGTADEARIHTDEWLVFDLGTAVDVQEFHVIGPLSEVFRFSTTGTYTLEANTADSWTSPALSISLTREAGGFHYYLDGETGSTEYRYWRFKWVDRDNSGGSQIHKIGHVYLGDYNTLTTSNVGTGYGRSQNDVSEVFESDSGAKWFRSRAKRRVFNSLSIGLMDTAAERIALEDMFDTLGIETPFYLSIDPLQNVSASASEQTMYCRFQAPPNFQNVIRDVYTMSFNCEEAV